MRLLPLVCGYLFSAVGFWLADSLLLTFVQEVTWLDAMWQDASPLRLLFRLIVTAFILIAGVVHVARRGSSDHVFHIHSVVAGNGIGGYAESDDKSQRLMAHCQKIAAAFKMPQQQKEALLALCRVYDIGLISVDRQVLANSRKLNQEQQLAWDRHIDVGAEIAASIPQLATVAPLILCHEENFDGSGPKGVCGKEIPLACRIFQVALLYDNFTHPGNGKRMMICEEALNELGYYGGSVLDPEVISAFRKIMGYKGLADPATAKVFTFR